MPPRGSNGRSAPAGGVDWRSYGTQIVGITSLPKGETAAAAMTSSGGPVRIWRGVGSGWPSGSAPCVPGWARSRGGLCGAQIARDGLGGSPGVLALPMLTSFDYLVLREDETARRLIRPQVRASSPTTSLPAAR